MRSNGCAQVYSDPITLISGELISQFGQTAELDADMITPMFFELHAASTPLLMHIICIIYRSVLKISSHDRCGGNRHVTRQSRFCRKDRG